jgi:hypothetical protein
LWFDREVPGDRCVGLQLPDLPDDQHHEGCSSPTSNIACVLRLDDIDLKKGLHKENNRKFFWMGRLAMRRTLFNHHPQKSGTLLLVTAVLRTRTWKDLHGHERHKYQPGRGLNQSETKYRRCSCGKTRHDGDNKDCSNPPRIGIGDNKRQASQCDPHC